MIASAAKKRCVQAHGKLYSCWGRHGFDSGGLRGFCGAGFSLATYGETKTTTAKRTSRKGFSMTFPTSRRGLRAAA